MCDAGSNRAANIEWQQDENHEGWEGRCFNGHVHRTADVGQECECGSEIEFSPAVDSTRNRVAALDDAASAIREAVAAFDGVHPEINYLWEAQERIQQALRRHHEDA